jgi:hypothetical protein
MLPLQLNLASALFDIAFFVFYKLDTYFTKVGMYEHEFVLFKHNALILEAQNWLLCQKLISYAHEAYCIKL